MRGADRRHRDVAAASDGASFMPSPTIITFRPARFNSSIRAIFVGRRDAGAPVRRRRAHRGRRRTAGSRSPDSSLDRDAARLERRDGGHRIGAQALPHGEDMAFVGPALKATTETSGSRCPGSRSPCRSAPQKDGRPSLSSTPSTHRAHALPGLFRHAPTAAILLPTARATARGDRMVAGQRETARELENIGERCRPR